MIGNDIQTDIVYEPAIGILIQGILTDNIELIHQGIALGADVNIKVPFLFLSDDNLTILQRESHNPFLPILHYAKSSSAVHALLDAGADITYKWEDDSSVLHRFCKMGCPQIIDELITRGADVNAVDAHGYTPLHFASKPNIANKLIEAGALVNTKSNFGNTPLHFPENLELTKVLIAHGANVTSNSIGETPLHILNIKIIPLDILNQLLSVASYEDINSADDQGNTPLHIVAQIERPNKETAQVVRAFFKYGADNRTVNNDGFTPSTLQQDCAKRPGRVKDIDEDVANEFLKNTTCRKIR